MISKDIENQIRKKLDNENREYQQAQIKLENIIIQTNIDIYNRNCKIITNAILNCINNIEINRYITTKLITLEKFTIEGCSFCWLSMISCTCKFCKYHFSLDRCPNIKSYLNCIKVYIKRSDYLQEKVRITYNLLENSIGVVNEN